MKNAKLTDFPMEQNSESMVLFKRILWRPNNYRRGMDILYLKHDVKLSSIRKVKRYLSFPVEVSSENRNKLIYLTLSPNIKVMIGKKRLVGIWSQNRIGGHKETFLLESKSSEELERKLKEKKKEISLQIDRAVKYVGKRLGVLKPYARCGWIRHEDWIKGEEFIDSIPRETIVHDTVFKKVYGEGVEFIGGKDVEPGARLKNYIKNRALEDFSPVIHEELCVLRESNLVFAENLKLHLEVLGKIGKGIDKLSKAVSRLEKKGQYDDDPVNPVSRPDYVG